MRLRDREERGFPSPLLLSYTSSSSFLPPPPCRSRCRWQGNADTSQSLPLSDEHLLPRSHLTLLFHICLTSLPVFFRSNISFCLSCFVSVDGPFPPFSLGSILSYLAVFSSLPPIIPPLSSSQVDSFLSQGQVDRLTDIYCQDVHMSYDNSVAMMHRVNILRHVHRSGMMTILPKNAARRDLESMVEVPLRWHLKHL